MQEKDLFKQLNTLKSIKPDRAWKERNREILFKQISAEKNENKLTVLQVLESFIPARASKIFAQPVWTAAVIVALTLIGGTAGVFASRNSKPGDSLYIAKIISERTQLALTFDEKEKVKLNIAFAGNRAKELFQVINETKGEKNQEKIEKLSNDFKKEIAAAKSGLGKIAPADNGKQENKAATNRTQQPAALEKTNDDSQVFSAESGRSEQGMNMAEHNNTQPSVSAQPEKQQETASSTNSTPEVKSGVLGKTLDEAESLLDSKDINGALDKLTEAKGIINGGEVKSGETENGKTTNETATSSGEVLGTVEKNDIE